MILKKYLFFFEGENLDQILLLSSQHQDSLVVALSHAYQTIGAILENVFSSNSCFEIIVFFASFSKKLLQKLYEKI